MPLWFHYHVLGWFVERTTIAFPSLPSPRSACFPKDSPSQVHNAPPCPANSRQEIPFSDDQIRKGLPSPGPFRLGDLRCRFCEAASTHRHLHHVF